MACVVRRLLPCWAKKRAQCAHHSHARSMQFEQSMRKNEKEEWAMPRQEKRFTARRVDAQFEQFAPAALPPLDTPNKHVVESLQTMYGKQIQQEQQSIERMRQRLSLAVAARQQE